MIESNKIVPFQVFQAHCCERNFMYAGRTGYFNVSCKLPEGPDRCNPEVCPIWNSDRVKEPLKGLPSLRDINMHLKKKQEPRRRPYPPASGRRPYQARVEPPVITNIPDML